MGKLFSDRLNHTSPVIHPPDFLSDDARNRLWNLLAKEVFWFHQSRWGSSPLSARSNQGQVIHIVSLINDSIFKYDFDEFKGSPSRSASLAKQVVMSGDWNNVYDLMEIVIHYPHCSFGTLIEPINQILSQEGAGYIWVENGFVPVLTTSEVEEVQEALSGLEQSRIHFEEALRLLGDKDCVDFRNSASESFKGLEATARHISGKPSATLGDALSFIHTHKSLQSGWKKIYGYGSDGDGIRHAVKTDSAPVPRELAKYLLISCCAFSNYLVSQHAVN